jgi:PDZ domain
MRTRKALLTGFLLAVGLFSGCAGNPYAKFYQDGIGGKAIAQVPALIPHTGDPQLYTTTDMDRDARSLIENGYGYIGQASFNAGSVDNGYAIDQARQVGAAIVLVKSRYTNTVSGAVPFTTQNPSQTVTTYHQGSVYSSGSSGGYGNYFGTSTTTVPGGYTTTYIPYSVNRFDYAATFWAKVKRPVLGVKYVRLTDEAKKEIESNHGVLVDVVIKGSPAYEADILKGDIITKVGEEAVGGPEDFQGILARHVGQDVQLEVYRAGSKRLISVKLNERSF